MNLTQEGAWCGLLRGQNEPSDYLNGYKEKQSKRVPFYTVRAL